METLQIFKIGGNLMNDVELLNKFIGQWCLLPHKKILIHGGGKLLNELAEKLNLPQEMINGRRITNAETLKLTTMVYAGYLNKKIVAKIQSQGNTALGLSGADMNCISAHKRPLNDIDYGFVGDITTQNINVNIIEKLLQQSIIPVFSSITHNNQGQLFNTNADTIASTLACALASNFRVELIFCFDHKGVLKNIDNQDDIIPIITENDFQTLKKDNIVSKGMLPKLENAFKALKAGVHKVVLIHYQDIGSFQHQDRFCGTQLIV